MVSAACCRPMNHRLLMSAADTFCFLSALWNVFAIGRSSFGTVGSCTCMDDIKQAIKVDGSCTVPWRPGSKSLVDWPRLLVWMAFILKFPCQERGTGCDVDPRASQRLKRHGEGWTIPPVLGRGYPHR